MCILSTRILVLCCEFINFTGKLTDFCSVTCGSSNDETEPKGKQSNDFESRIDALEKRFVHLQISLTCVN